MQQFYEQLISEARERIPGLKQNSSEENQDLQAFTNQHFLMWDYLIGVGKGELGNHFVDLTALCKARQIPRVIMFIKDPSTFSEFAPENFATLATALINEVNTALPSSVQPFTLSVFFETGDFNYTSPSPGTLPTVNPVPDQGDPSKGVPPKPNYFTDLPNMLNWVRDVNTAAKNQHQQIAIAEFAFDPEAAGANKNYQQLVYNYSDEYKYLNSMTNIAIGTTLGIDESKIVYANLSTFPVPELYHAAIATFPTSPSWRPTSAQSLPLLKSVYIQAYQSNIPSIFNAGYNQATGAHSGTLAGTRFNKMLQDQPYLVGTGKISFSAGSTQVTGTGTNFTPYSNALLFTTLATDPSPKKIGIVSKVSSPTKLTLSSHATFSTSVPVSFTRTETVTGWNIPGGITQSILNGIYWMFSLNYEAKGSLYFFGNWQLGDFMSFVGQVQTLNKTNPPFKNSTDAPIYPPKGNYAIYNYDFATTIVNKVPKDNGQIAPWNLQSSE